jgi:hypothetical protein
MTKIIHRKTVDTTIPGIVLSEHDLNHIASLVNLTTAKYNGEVEIKITTADGEDTIRISTPEFLLTDEMPKNIRSVLISFHEYKAPVSCTVTLTSFPFQDAKVSVDGTDTTVVSGLFRDLEKELKGHQTSSSWLISKLDGLGFHFIVSSLLAIAIYSVFDIPLNIAKSQNEAFKDSVLYSVIVNAGWFAIFVAFAVGAYPVIKALKNMFPSVRFVGNLSDLSTKRRSKVIWLLMAILLPIILNVLSGLLISILHR